MLKEMPKVGDRVMCISDGKEYIIEGHDEDGDAYYKYGIGRGYIQNSFGICNYGEFVLVENKTSPQTDRDLIIELAYTVAKLERKVERLEEALEKTDGKAEMLIDDVAMLDERTQPLTDDGAKEFADGLADVIEGYVNDRITRDQIRRAYD